MVWPVLTRWTRFLWKDAVYTRKNFLFLFLFIIYYFFLILNFFLIFIFIYNNRNKITFKKILVNPKFGYNSCPLFTMLTVQRHWKIHFLLTLHSKFCKEKRWKCWKIHRFFGWSNSYGRPAQVKNMKVFSILVLWNTWKWFQQWCCEIHESDFNNGPIFQMTTSMIKCDETRKWSNCSRRPCR